MSHFARRLRSTVAAAILCAQSISAYAQNAVDPAPSAAALLCDRLAARDNDLGTTDRGVPSAQIKPAEAIPACEAAAKADPENPRYLDQLGRALLAKRDDTAARQAFAAAADKGHAYASIRLAWMHRNGRGGPHDLAAAYRLVEKAAATGDAQALNTLAAYVRSGLGTEHDLDRWIDLLEQAAEAGSVSALRQLAVAHADGIGVPKNADIAEDLFLSVIEHHRPRAEQGHVDSMWVMGWAHERGAGVPKDLGQALAWYSKGEALGDADSIFAVGWLYDNGIGVPRDKAKACNLFERAADEGNGHMLNALAWCFASGEGRERDLPRARSLYERATAAGDAFAARNLARLYEDGRGVARDMRRAGDLYRVAAERGHAQGMLDYGYHLRTQEPKRGAEACDWFERAAGQGLARAMNNLAACYTADAGLRPKNVATAIAWYERAGTLNDGLALRNLGDIYLLGQGVDKNPSKAFGYFRRGADAGDAGAMVEYGMLLTRGATASPDAKTGCDWFEKAANVGDNRGMNNIGACYANGDGRTANLTTGVTWYEKAIAAGDALAMANLGELLMTGRGVPRDQKRALDLFKRSADLGHAAGAVEYAAALYHGNGINKDPAAACTWYEQAAKANHPTGLNGLGVCQENGFGRRRDVKAAAATFAKAADAGSLTALRNLVRFADRGIGGPRSPEAAADWMRKAFERGHESLLNDIMSYPSSWSRDARRALQKNLKRDGLYDGPVDGFMSASLDTALWSKVYREPTPAPRPRLVQEFAWAPIEGAANGLLVRICKAADAGTEKRPLVVINHGLTTDEPERRDMRPISCGAIASFFVQRGYTVAVPLRRGYGETGGRFAEGGTRVCSTSPDFVAPGLAIASDIQATITHMQSRPDVAASGAIVLGHSGGGWGALALASRNAAGIAGFVNISGVHGSNRNRPDGVCGPDPITRSTRAFGRTARTPTLWIYAENDSHAGPRLVKRMFDGFQQAGGNGTLHVLPAYDVDGHNIFDDDSFDLWGNVVEDWLNKLKR